VFCKTWTGRDLVELWVFCGSIYLYHCLTNRKDVFLCMYVIFIETLQIQAIVGLVRCLCVLYTCIVIIVYGNVYILYRWVVFIQRKVSMRTKVKGNRLFVPFIKLGVYSVPCVKVYHLSNHFLTWDPNISIPKYLNALILYDSFTIESTSQRCS
jgi:hypothetical protein